MYHKRGLWAIKAKNGGAFPKHEKKSVVAAPVEKPPKFYPANDVKKPLVNKHKARLTKLRDGTTYRQNRDHEKTRRCVYTNNLHLNENQVMALKEKRIAIDYLSSTQTSQVRNKFEDLEVVTILGFEVFQNLKVI
ncbi:hypothetical protein L6452_00926 [Arctium lappa]|uniref:Uncharacterized protein n=1 Tax=Arctium lappa TaxID=4217 RepID=A0ACB9FFW8_ARCLA|nr:hypothetical protein L6452_00926 [Arctium lappa]